MKRISALWICLVVLTRLLSANPTEKWFRGSVVLSDQQVIVGEIAVYPTHHLIMFRSDEGVTVLPAKKIDSFFFYDSAANINRKFISRVNQESAYQHHQLYEVVLTGIIPVLRMQDIWSRGVDNAHDFKYFVLYDDTVIELQKFKRLVYPKIIKQSKELLAFVKKDHLDPGQSANAIKIIQYFNRCGNQDVLAMN